MCSSAAFVACSFVIFVPAGARSAGGADCCACAAAVAGASRRMASRQAWVDPFMAISFPEKKPHGVGIPPSPHACPRTRELLPGSRGLGAQPRNVGLVEIVSSRPRRCEASLDEGPIAVLRDGPDREFVGL